MIDTKDISDQERIGCLEKEVHELKKRVHGLEKIKDIKSGNPPMDVIEVEPGTMVCIGDIKPDTFGLANWYAYALEALEILSGSGMVDDEVCVIDDCFCETHGFRVSPCPVGRARDLIKEFHRDVKTMTRVKKEAERENQK